MVPPQLRLKSELGILYRNDFNAKVLNKLLKDNNLEFHDLFSCGTYVYLWKDHPLADQAEITMEELANISGGFHYEIPCLIGKRVPRRYVKNGKEVGGMMCRDEEYEGF